MILALLVVGAIILWLWFRTSSLIQGLAKSQGEVNRISGRIQQEAMAQFQTWRQKEYDMLKNQEAEVAHREAHVELAQWKVVSEAAFRADAIQRSRSVIVGKVTEHVVPYLPDFNYNPKDARFIGSPVDFVVFDGLDEGAVRQVLFIEVKTGSSSLSKRERQVRDAVLAKNVRWEEMRVEPPEGSVVTSTGTTGGGQGMSQDVVQAVASYRTGAEQGQAIAQYNLGWAYANGRGVEKDHTEAVRWFRMAGEQGDADAQYSLGEAYDLGEGVKDFAQAAGWFRKAAEQGDPEAQYSLGFAYRFGLGVAQDNLLAIQWYGKAAENGHDEAQHEPGSVSAQTDIQI